MQVQTDINSMYDRIKLSDVHPLIQKQSDEALTSRQKVSLEQNRPELPTLLRDGDRNIAAAKKRSHVEQRQAKE